MSANADPFTDRVVLLAGATGELGRATALLLRRRGVRLGLVARKQRQVDALNEAFGREGVLVGCVGPQDGEAAAGFVKGVADSLGPIDALIAAVGAFAVSPIGKDAAGQLAELMEANLFAVANLARAVVGPMRRRRTGTIVAVGSAAVGGGASGMANYLASKAALHTWIEALARELDGSGVRALAVLPTVIDTNANRAAQSHAHRETWQSLEEVAGRLCALALGPSPGPGALFPVRP